MKMPLNTFLTLLTVSACIGMAGCRTHLPAEAPAEAPGADLAAAKPVTVRQYVIGAGDSLDIAVFRQDSLHRITKVDTAGNIMFPLIGDVRVGGRGIFEVRKEMEERLKKYLVEPQVLITITDVQGQRVIVVGAVNNPGTFPLSSEMTMLDAIAKAGGMTYDAKLQSVVLVRRSAGGKPQVILVDLAAAIQKGATPAQDPLQATDILYVPEKVLAKTSRWFQHIGQILKPIVNLETGVVLWPDAVDAVKGASSSDTAPTRVTVPVGAE